MPRKIKLQDVVLSNEADAALAEFQSRMQLAVKAMRAVRSRIPKKAITRSVVVQDDGTLLITFEVKDKFSVDLRISPEHWSQKQ